jgi:hypothetical protein
MSPLFAGTIAAATGYEQFHTLTCPRSVLSAAADHLADECRAGPAPTTGSAGSRKLRKAWPLFSDGLHDG